MRSLARQISIMVASRPSSPERVLHVLRDSNPPLISAVMEVFVSCHVWLWSIERLCFLYVRMCDVAADSCLFVLICASQFAPACTCVCELRVS